jgi:hypothetical protein
MEGRGRGTRATSQLVSSGSKLLGTMGVSDKPKVP